MARGNSTEILYGDFASRAHPHTPSIPVLFTIQAPGRLEEDVTSVSDFLERRVSPGWTPELLLKQILAYGTYQREETTYTVIDEDALLEQMAPLVERLNL